MHKITIVVPVYLSEQFLNKTIESLINQTLKDVEIILIDDGSPDGSGIICDSVALRDNRIKVIHQNNLGAAHAMYKGVMEANSDYIMFLDADDWIGPDTCNEVYSKAIESKADIVMWSFVKEFADKSLKNLTFLKSDQIFDGLALRKLNRRLVGLYRDELKNPTTTDAISSGWGKLFNKKLILNTTNCLIDDNGNENFDVVLNIRLFSKATKVAYIHKFFNHYRQSNLNSITKTHGNTLFSKYKTMFSSILNTISDFSDNTEFLEAYYNRVALSSLNCVLSIVGKRNEQSFANKLKAIKLILSDPQYQQSFRLLKINYLPFHFRLFFVCCKQKWALAVMGLGYIMRTFR